MKYYNEERVHSALDYKTPNEMAAIYGKLLPEHKIFKNQAFSNLKE